MKKFLLITFGCPKNEVDSDFVAGQLIEAGFNPTPVLEEADFVIVNTCSFLRSAVSENLRAIKKLSNLKKKFNFTLVVTGCLVNRFREKIFDLDVNVDFWIPGNFQPRLAEILSTGNAEFLNFEEQNYLFSARSTKSVVVDRKYAYLKISEGCNRPCSFCVIPKIRGSFRSRRIENILDEAVMLIDQGFKEIILVAQDLSNYGVDIYGKPSLPILLSRLNSLYGNFWIRLLYLYPLGLTDELLEHIMSLPKVVNYIDIPFQHSSERMLKIMRRPSGKFSARKLVEKIRLKSSNLAIRTTFIVGHPGETKQDFDDLLNFVREYELDHVGVFCYSDEEEALSFEMTDKVGQSTAIRRRRLILELQREISAKKLACLRGKILNVLVDRREGNMIICRAEFQAPEIDGVVYVHGGSLNGEDFVDVKITDSLVYDLVASRIGSEFLQILEA